MKASLLLAGVTLYLVLIQPNHPGALTWRALFALPLELPAILLAAVALGTGRAGVVLRVVLTVVLTVIAVLKCADLVSFNALSRGFNPVSDMALIDAFVRLLSGAVGPVLTVLVILCSILASVLIAFVIWWALGRWAQLNPPRAMFYMAPALLVAGLAVTEVGHTMKSWRLPFKSPATAFTARVGAERVVMVQNTLSKLATFRAEVQTDPFRGARDLFDKIDRDVLVIFVESYGRTSLDTEFYASVHRETLARYQASLNDLELSMRSGILSAPTRGGQSWLSHSTLSNGLWIDNQVSYGAALSSGRETLFHHAANNGFHTATVMPQITLDWPESSKMGFETILASKDLGYEGLPFNWVTMPDQFTLSALDRLLRDAPRETPLFVQIALATSHAPWVPVPQIIAWDDIGDGTVFNEMALSGDTPKVVWRDRARVRAQYRLAVDYALSAVFEYAALHAEDPPLMIVIGDHQAAEFIALDARSDVPVHLIGPPELVDALATLAPDEGLLPNADTMAIPMNEVRDMILNAYSSNPRQGAGG